MDKTNFKIIIKDAKVTFEIPYVLKDEDQLCFVHIPKTGGSTLLPILESFFYTEEICSLREEIRRLPIEELHQYKLICAHGYFNEFLTARTPPPKFLTFLRHPIERTLSTFKFISRLKHHPQHHELKRMTLEEYVDSDFFITRFVDNVQSRVLSDIPMPTNNQPEDYHLPDIELAKKRLEEDFFFIGILERYQESLDLLSFSLRWPKFYDYEVINVTPDPIKRSTISQEVTDKIRELNQYDLELYQFATELFSERIAYMKT